MIKRVSRYVIVVLLLILHGYSAYAAMSSASYSLSGDFNGGGWMRTSPNFTMTSDSIGISTLGFASSTQYALSAGIIPAALGDQTVQSRTCSIVNGTGTQTSLDGGLTWSLCIATSCYSGYDLVSGNCVLANESRACSIANGSGSQSSADGGVTWGTCVATSCYRGYVLNNGACVVSVSGGSGGAGSGAVAVGYDPQWLIATIASLMLAGGYLLRKRRRMEGGQ